MPDLIVDRANSMLKTIKKENYQAHNKKKAEAEEDEDLQVHDESAHNKITKEEGKVPSSEV